MSDYKKTALVLGAGGFIGSHMVKRLRAEGYWVCGVDLKLPEYSESEAHEFIVGDLRDVPFVERVLQYKGPYRNFYNFVSSKYIDTFDEIYQFAADMGGAGFVFTGENDADIMHNSVSINLNVLEAQRQLNDFKQVNKTKIFYSGSACMYPEHNQLDPDNPDCREESAYPANPDSEYGWEKLFSERLYFAYNRNYDISVGLLATTIFLDQREPGLEEEKRLLLQSAERLQNFLQREGLLTYGEMESKLVHSFILMNVLKQREGLWILPLLDQ
jgi:nucleoside-diphosphate-sugar epimerase